jgi:nucleotide-binding universal stress UspA family protein
MENMNHPRVVVGIDQTLAGYAALRVAVGIARSRGVPLQAIRAAAGIDMADEQYIDDTFREALGGLPSDVELTKSVIFASAVSTLARNASDPRDLLVVGNDGRGSLRAFWSGSVGRGLFRRARCQILVVPAPEMHKKTRRSVRKLRRPRVDVWDRFESEVPELRGRPFQGT